MKILTKNVSLPIRWIILIVFLILITFGLAYLFLLSDGAQKNLDSNLSSIIGGVIAGLIIATVQFLLSWFEYKRNDLFEKISVINVLNNKYNIEKYRKIIENVNDKLWIMGNTADDFLTDFADNSNTESERKVLLSCLAKNIEVRILIAKREKLNSEAQRKYDNALPKLSHLKIQYPSLKVKYYNHEPAHSIFIFDDESFIGPVFSGVSSRQTPALHMKNKSPFAKKYIDHFIKEWESASED